MNRVKPSYIFAVLFTPIAAGPIFLLMLWICFSYADLPKPVEIGLSSEEIGGGLIVVMFSFIPGWILAVLPCLLCTSILANLGKERLFFRSVPVWVIFGFLVIIIPGALLGGFEDRNGPKFTIALALTAAVCAFICRKLTYWSVEDKDNSTLAPIITMRPAAQHQKIIDEL